MSVAWFTISVPSHQPPSNGNNFPPPSNIILKMKTVTLRFLCFASIASMAVSTGLPAGEPAIIAKARSYLGTEAALNAVNTLHFYGTLELSDATTEEEQTPIKVEIQFERPFRQRSVITSAKGTEITVLSEYDAWQRVSASNDTKRWNLALLQTEQIKNLRANVWENLSFFRGLESIGGQVKDLGIETVEEQSCRKLAFIHSPEIIFYRYFNETSGRLVLTETLRGERIREGGTMVVAGVKFPQTLTTFVSRPDGSTQTITIKFDRVTVNEAVEPGTFEMPLLISK